jgi:predicted GTPase
MVKDAEVMNFLIHGTIGVGKSTLIRWLLTTFAGVATARLSMIPVAPSSRHTTMSGVTKFSVRTTNAVKTGCCGGNAGTWLITKT